MILLILRLDWILVDRGCTGLLRWDIATDAACGASEFARVPGIVLGTKYKGAKSICYVLVVTTRESPREGPQTLERVQQHAVAEAALNAFAMATRITRGC